MITRMTPKYRVSPAARSAYSPPSSTPSTTLWKISAPETTRRSPRRLGEDQVGFLQVVGQDDLDLALDPLLDHVRALRPALVVPLQRADDGVDRVAAQPLDELLLAGALLGAADRGDDRRD